MSITPKTTLTLRAVGALAATLLCSAAQATIVVPGGDVSIVPEEFFEGTRVVTTPRSFSVAFGSGTISGTVRDNLFLLPGDVYGFETQLIISQAPAGVSVDKVVRTDYAGFTTDARPEPDLGGSQEPTRASRSASPGSSVSFIFLGDNKVTVGPSGSTAFVILTNAPDFAEVGQLRLGSGDTFSDPIAVYSPVGVPVPEPAQWLTIVAGLGLLGTLARRRS